MANTDVQNLVKEFLTLHEKTQGLERMTTKTAYEAGLKLIALQQRVKKLRGGSWDTFCKAQLPHVCKNSIQRYMLIARSIDPNHVDAMCALSQGDAVKLGRIAKKEVTSVPTLLEQHGIAIPKSEEGYAQFSTAVHDLANGAKNQASASLGTPIVYVKKCTACVLRNKRVCRHPETPSEVIPAYKGDFPETCPLTKLVVQKA